MRSLIIIIALLLLHSCKLSNSTDSISTEVITNPIDPDGIDESEIAEFSFKETTIDLGSMTQGEKRNTAFVFKNKGKMPLYISAVNASCGCTLPKGWPKEGIEIGDSGQIEVEFNSENKIGHTTAELTVVANTLPSSTILLIKANIIGPE